MILHHRRAFGVTVFATTIAFSWSFVAFPTICDAQINQQAEVTEGAIQDAAPYDGTFAVLEGKTVKFTNGVEVFDTYELPAVGWRVLQTNTRTYVLDSTFKIHIIDSSNKNSTSCVGTYDLLPTMTGDATDFDLFGTSEIVVMTESKQMLRVDLSDEQNLTCSVQENMGQMFEYANGVSAVCDDGTLHKLDTSSSTWTRGQGTTTGAEDVSMDASGDKAYTGAGNEVKAWDLTGLVPVLLATFVLSGTFLSLVAGANSDEVFVSYDEFGSLAVVLLALSIALFSVVSTAFMNYKGHPKLAIDPLNAAMIVVALGTVAVALQATSQFMTLLFTFFGLNFVHKMTVATLLGAPHLLVSGDTSGILLWDVLTPWFPIPVAVFSLTYALWCFRMLVATTSANDGGTPGPYAIGAVGESGVITFDMETPSTPQWEDFLFTGGDARDLYLVGSLAYVADGAMGLQIVDASDPTSTLLLNTVPLPSAARRLTVVADHAYVSTDLHGLRIVDVSNPGTASEAGAVASLANIGVVANDGSSLYIGAGNELHIFGLTDPTTPNLLGTHPFSATAVVADVAIVDVVGAAESLAPAASKLGYVAAGTDGLVVVDLSDPATPSDVVTHPMDFASSVAVDGHDVYAGNGAAGFVVLDIDPATVPVLFNSFRARAVGRSVEITWDLNVDERVSGIDVLRSSGAATLPVKLNAGGSLPASTRSFKDERVEANRTYQYSIVVKTANGLQYRSPSVTVEMPPRSLEMLSPYPNPFNPTTTIAFELPAAGYANVSIYDAAGRLVVTLLDGPRPAGLNEIEWDATGSNGNRVGSGVYVARVVSDGVTKSTKLTLLK